MVEIYLAQKTLKENEEMTFSNEEIDAFLPKMFRKKNSQNEK